MARIFDVTPGSEAVHLNNAGTGEMPFTVTNVGSRPVRGRVRVVAQEPAKAAWLAIPAGDERDFPVGGTQQFRVAVKIPAGTSEATYSFRLDVISVDNPDEDFTRGPAVSIPVVLVAPAARPFPWWILAVMAAVLLVGGFTVWYFASGKPSPAKPPVTQVPATPPPPTPELVAPPTGRVYIVNKNSQLCLSPAGGARDNNIETVQYLCDGDPARLWNFRVVEKNIVQMVNFSSARCLTVAGGNKLPNNPSVQYNCDEDPSRRWQFVPVDADTFQLKNVNSELCLAITGAGKENNQVALQVACSADPAQNWQVRAQP
ncbi:MAG: Ricin lectin [Bryobacterales bacterium]|nr:Ricin lectin [Bryobacterales bacterium]